MKWRPEGWRNPRTYGYSEQERLCYEHGADEMIKVVIDEIERLRGTSEHDDWDSDLTLRAVIDHFIGEE